MMVWNILACNDILTCMSKYQELQKKFDGLRDSLRNFFIFGDVSRAEFAEKNLERTYDNELRRIKSWFKDIVKCESFDGEKRYCISVDPSAVDSNPFYAAFKCKSFTNTDVNLHFFLLSILKDRELPIKEIIKELDDTLGDVAFEPQTVRLKLNEYVELGLIKSEKRKNVIYYSLSDTKLNSFIENNPELLKAIKFFSETAPLPVIGSYISDKFENKIQSVISYRHHFLAFCLDDVILFEILNAMQTNSYISIVSKSIETYKEIKMKLFPLKIFVSTNTGRRFLIGFSPKKNNFSFYRLDYIKDVKIEEKAKKEEIEYYRRSYNRSLPYCFTVSIYNDEKTEHFEMVLRIDEKNEAYVLNRLKNEARNGIITKIAQDTFKYEIDVYSTLELMPWVKTFIGYILKLSGDNEYVISCFYKELEEMAKCY